VTGMASSALLVRAASLYLPITIAGALVIHRRPDRRRVAAALLATAWNLSGLLAVNLVAGQVGWWHFDADAALVAGVPADLWVGWALLWGAVPVLASTARLWLVGGALVAADLVLMPMAEPVLRLGGGWLIGETVAVVCCLVPGLLLGRWTADDERLTVRATQQLVAFAGLAYFVVPTLIFTTTGEGWAPLLVRPRWHFVIAGVCLAPVAAMAVQAVREFVRHGGTPVPLDPPRRLVASGPYSYVANPMQLCGTVLLAAWGLLLASPAVVAAAALSAAFSAGIAAWNEDNELGERFGEEWHQYRQGARLWIPRWRPTVTERAVVYVAGTCEPCSEVGGFLARRDPVGLDITPAETCPTRLRRITYQRGRTRVSGIAAVGHSFEHANLGWAVVGWIGCLPGIQQLLQLITDAVGGGPRSIVQVGQHGPTALATSRTVSGRRAPPAPARGEHP
jgi:protein-S-isoprenylcysteine O-methyltransferase Ste14